MLNCDVFVESDGSAYIKLIDVTDGREKFAIATFEAVNAGTGATGDNAAATQIAAAINASKRDIFADVTAAVDGSDANQVNITVPIGYIFRGASNDASGDVTQGTPPALPFGTPAAVRADILSALPFQGVTNLGGTNIVQPADVVGVNTYQAFEIFVEQTVGVRKDTHEIILYIPSGNGTLNEDLDTLLGL